LFDGSQVGLVAGLVVITEGSVLVFNLEKNKNKKRDRLRTFSRIVQAVRLDMYN
jgi:hypothetical protein